MSDPIRVIGPEDWTDMAWRNGGGTTSEICAERDKGAWLWRLSTAIVAHDGPYSRFPGLTRISTVIAGAGAEISGSTGGEWQRIRPLTPTRLDGNRGIHGRLLGGPIRYLNLIFDPTRLSAQVSVRLLAGSGNSGNEPSLIFCVDGCCEIGTSPGIVIDPLSLAMNVPAGTELGATATLVVVVLKEAN